MIGAEQFSKDLENIDTLLNQFTQTLTLEDIRKSDARTIVEGLIKTNILEIPTIDWAEKQTRKHTERGSTTSISGAIKSGSFEVTPARDIYTVTLPFKGVHSFFNRISESLRVLPSIAKIERNKLIVVIAGEGLEPEDAKRKFDFFKQQTEAFLSDLRLEYQRCLEKWRSELPKAIEERKRILEKDEQDLKVFNEGS